MSRSRIGAEPCGFSLPIGAACRPTCVSSTCAPGADKKTRKKIPSVFPLLMTGLTCLLGRPRERRMAGPLSRAAPAIETGQLPSRSLPRSRRFWALFAKVAGREKAGFQQKGTPGLLPRIFYFLISTRDLRGGAGLGGAVGRASYHPHLSGSVCTCKSSDRRPPFLKKGSNCWPTPFTGGGSTAEILECCPRRLSGCAPGGRKDDGRCFRVHLDVRRTEKGTPPISRQAAL